MEEPATSVQVVVIGAGFAGAATAWALTRLGITDIIVLEREYSWGAHASGRNAAMCRQLVEDTRVSDYTVAGAAFLAHPPDGFAEGSLLQRTGSLLLCQSGIEVARLAQLAERRGIEHEICGEDAVIKACPHLAGMRSAGGVRFPGDGVIDIHALLNAYVSQARSAGVHFALANEATGFRPYEKGVIVEAPRGDIYTTCVVDAAGAWAGIVGDMAGSVSTLQPSRRHLFLTETVENLKSDSPFVWYLGDDEFYLRPEGTGLLVSACDAEPMKPCDVRAAPDAVDRLAAKMNAHVPSLSDVGIARSWACLRTFTKDRRPLIGWDNSVSWLFWVAGLGGHGATGSSAVGQAAASAIYRRL